MTLDTASGVSRIQRYIFERIEEHAKTHAPTQPSYHTWATRGLDGGIIQHHARCLVCNKRIDSHIELPTSEDHKP